VKKIIKLEEGMDLTNILQIKKYDPIADAEAKLESESQSRQKNKINKFLKRWSWYRRLFGKKKKGGFPGFIKKTDETRLQTIPNILEEYKDDVFSVSEKLDGTSLTCFMVQDKTWYGKKKYTFGVCSRNIYLSKQDNSNYWKIAKKYNIENVLRNIIGDSKCIVLQGEIIGMGIQENKYGLKDLDFYAFNLIFDNIKFNNYTSIQLLQEQNIKFVPIIDNNFKLKSTVNEMVDYSNGRSLVATNTLREGIVCRNYEKDISFKVVSPEFLLKYGE
jgi:RNA ligase (TIGR02306 family)